MCRGLSVRRLGKSPKANLQEDGLCVAGSLERGAIELVVVKESGGAVSLTSYIGKCGCERDCIATCAGKK